MRCGLSVICEERAERGRFFSETEQPPHHCFGVHRGCFGHLRSGIRVNPAFPRLFWAWSRRGSAFRRGRLRGCKVERRAVGR